MQAKYTYYPGTMAPHSVRRGGQTYYYATDMLGSVLALFNSSNTVVNQYAYLPFGEAQSTSETAANPLRFAGRELDGSSGLYYNNARWYDPLLHRFISEDPSGIDGGINLYAYVGNDPVNVTDPSGLAGCKYRGHTFVPLITGYNDGWECGGWGVPAWLLAEIMTIRRAAARQCDPLRCDDGFIPVTLPVAPPADAQRREVAQRVAAARAAWAAQDEAEMDECLRKSGAGKVMAFGLAATGTTFLVGEGAMTVQTTTGSMIRQIHTAETLTTTTVDAAARLTRIQRIAGRFAKPLLRASAVTLAATLSYGVGAQLACTWDVGYYDRR